MTLPPAPVWSVSLSCYVRPQPVEFLEIPSSGGSQWEDAFVVPPETTDDPE